MASKWSRPPHRFRSEGAGGLTMFTTMIGLGFGALIVVNLMLGLPAWWSYGLFPGTLIIIFIGLIVSAGGRSFWEITLDGYGRSHQITQGEHIYRSGPFTAVPHGTPLPGLAARTRIFDVAPHDGSEAFALIHLPQKRFYTLVLRAWPQGREWVSPDRIDLWVARLGDAIAFLAQSPDVIAISPVLETVPETGQRASRLVRERLDPSSPVIVRQAITEAVEEVPSADVRLESRIAITISADTQFRRRDSDEVAVDISRRLRRIMDHFELAGVLVRPMMSHELTAIVRRAFSPGDEAELEAALMTGEPMDLPWSEAGPATASDEHSVFIHDAAKSVSWTLELPPESAFDYGLLADLLSPRADLPRKRVAFVWQPYTPAEATKIVNRDDADARQAIRTHVGRLSERALVRAEHATAARQEQARGAGVSRVSMVITATSPAHADIVRTETLLTNLTLSAALRVRPANGQQAPAFLAGLGIGIVLPEMASASDRLAA